MSATASGKVVVVALPMPQGLSQTAARIRAGADANIGSCSARATSIRTIFFLLLLLITVVCLLLQRLARAVSVQADYPAR